jgi:hypothetical protein
MSLTAQTDIVLDVVLAKGSKHAVPSAGVKPTVSLKLLRWPGQYIFCWIYSNGVGQDVGLTKSMIHRSSFIGAGKTIERPCNALVSPWVSL